MKKGWEEVRLGSLCNIQSGSSNTQDAIPDGNFIFFDRSKQPKRSNRFLFDCEAIIIAGEGTEFLPKKYAGKFDLHQRAYAIFGFDDFLMGDYLFYYLVYIHKYFQKVAVGATVKSLRQRHFEDLPVLLPQSIDEQKQIVTLLSEAFEGIDRSIANTEKNLENAHKIFESYLNIFLIKNCENWETKKLEDCIEDVKYPNKVQRKLFQEEGLFPIVSQEREYINGYWSNEMDAVRVTRPLIVFGDHTQVLKYIDFDFVLGADGVKILQPRPYINPRFFYYFLIASPIKSLGYARHYRVLKELNIRFPTSLEEQVKIAENLDRINNQSKNLLKIYEKKIRALKDLKQSLLQKAFNGELTVNINHVEQVAA